MKHIEFTVFGEPQGKARPRFTRMGRAYTPKKTADYESTQGFSPFPNVPKPTL